MIRECRSCGRPIADAEEQYRTQGVCNATCLQRLKKKTKSVRRPGRSRGRSRGTGRR